MELAGLDPATARLGVELQLADVDTILGGLEAKQDGYAAFECMRVCFEEILPLLQDRAFAMDILRVDHDSRVAIQALVREERQAEEDHSLARQLSGLAPTQCDSPEPKTPFERHDSFLNDEDCLSLYSPNTTTTSKAPITTEADEFQPTFFFDHMPGDKLTGATATSSTPQPPKGKRNAKDPVGGDDHITHTFCSACMERHARFDVLELGCRRQGDVTDHAYCRTCLIDLFRASLTDTTLFPPRCCGVRIPITASLHLCPPELVKQYQDKQVELAQPNSGMRDAFCPTITPSIHRETELRCRKRKNRQKQTQALTS